MLDREDKKWIVETIDERLDRKLDEAKSELRGEMHEMETRICERVTEKVTADVTEQVTKNVTEKVTKNVTEKVTADVTEQVTRNVLTVFENTYGEYIKLIAELVPEKARSYDVVEERQRRQREEIDMIKIIAKDHETRIAWLERATL